MRRTHEKEENSQRDLDRLEDWVSENCMKFDKNKCILLPLGSHNQRALRGLGSVWKGSSLAERGPGSWRMSG